MLDDPHANQPRQRRPLRTVRRTVTTGAILAAAYLMYMMVPGGGGGTGVNDPSDDSIDSVSPQVIPTSADETSNPYRSLAAGEGQVTPNPLALPGSLSGSQVTPARSDQDVGHDTTAPASFVSGGVLTLLIDEYDYFVAVPSESDGSADIDADSNRASPIEVDYQTIALDDVTRLVPHAAGDANGIRVRVLRRATSRAAAEHRLQQQLQAAGVSSDAIYMSGQLLPN